eukprot:gene15950-17553_t
MQKLVVFGASGKTGRPLVEQALNIGHKVIAIARTPENLAEFKKYDSFEVKQGNALDRSTFEEAMTDADAVISCLGPARYVSIFETTSLYSDSMKEIHEAMKSHGISRLVAMSSWATQDHPDLPFFVRWILRPLMIKSYLVDLNQMEQYLATTDLNYTVCRASGLGDGPLSGKEISLEIDGQHVPGAATVMPRADVAKFMLSCLQSQHYDKKMLAIGIMP